MRILLHKQAFGDFAFTDNFLHIFISIPLNVWNATITTNRVATHHLVNGGIMLDEDIQGSYFGPANGEFRRPKGRKNPEFAGQVF